MGKQVNTFDPGSTFLKLPIEQKTNPCNSWVNTLPILSLRLA